MSRLVLIPALALVASLGAPVQASAAADPQAVKRYALFVGANQGGEGRQTLLYAQKDALKMRQVLEDVGGLGAGDSILLLDPEPNEITASLKSLAQRIAAPGAARRTEFLFYYSGHSDEDGLLLGPGALGYKVLRDTLNAVPADVRIAILDSCSSGAFARTKGGVQRAPFLTQDSSQMKGHAFLTSSSENEASQESDTLQGSFFTHYLVSGLRGAADQVGDGLITLDEAYAYAFQNTLARTEATRSGPQHPSYEIQLSGTGNLILSDIKDAGARLVVASDVQGRLFVRNLDGQLFAEVMKPAGSALTLALPAGVFSVTAVGETSSLAAQVTLKTRGTATLARRDFQEQTLVKNAVRGSGGEETDGPSTAEAWGAWGVSLIPGLPGSGWGTAGKALSVGALVDFSQDLRGLQAAGLMAIDGGAPQGIQLAGVGALASGQARGFQGGGVFTIAGGGAEGGQFGGVFNISGSGGGPFQWAGVFNIASGTWTGFQGAGVFNIAQDLRGFQTAGTFNAAQDVWGGQLAPVNVAREVKGVQIGLVDINSHIDGFGVGLVFISPDAFYHPTVSFDGDGLTRYGFRWGMGSAYWALSEASADGSASDNRPWEASAGAGWRARGRFLTWDNDLGWLHRFQGLESRGGLPYLRSTLGLRTPLVGLEGGVTVTPEGQGFLPGGYPLRAVWFAGLRAF